MHALASQSVHRRRCVRPRGALACSRGGSAGMCCTISRGRHRPSTSTWPITSRCSGLRCASITRGGSWLQNDTFRCLLARVLLAMCTLHDMFGHIAVGSSVLAVQDVFGWCKLLSPQERRGHLVVLGEWQARCLLVLRLVPRRVQHLHPVCQDRRVFDGAS